MAIVPGLLMASRFSSALRGNKQMTPTNMNCGAFPEPMHVAKSSQQKTSPRLLPSFRLALAAYVGRYPRMTYRKPRIAWSVGWGLVAMLQSCYGCGPEKARQWQLGRWIIGS